MGIKVVAECGCNWKSISEAYEMIKRAKEVGCFAAKFQLFSKEQAKETGTPEFLSLTKKQAYALFSYGYFMDMEVFFTCMNENSVDWCEDFGVKYYKIRYADNANYELYKKVEETKKFTFISTDCPFGIMWKNLVDYKRGMFLYCVPEYPACISDYDDAFNLGFRGISDHTRTLELLKTAKENKIDYFEKHLKLDNTTPLEDKWSVSFSELKEVLKNDK